MRCDSECKWVELTLGAPVFVCLTIYQHLYIAVDTYTHHDLFLLLECQSVTYLAITPNSAEKLSYIWTKSVIILKLAFISSHTIFGNINWRSQAGCDLKLKAFWGNMMSLLGFINNQRTNNPVHCILILLTYFYNKQYLSCIFIIRHNHLIN